MKEGLKPDLYCGQAAVLTTKHGKDRAIARPFRASLGLVITVKDEIDTDQLGTFTGEIERVGTPREVAIRKARLGMEAQFPSHALIVRPNEGLKPGFLFKGVADLETLNGAVMRCAPASGDGWAHVETDMRAHVNPTRQKVIRRPAFRLARRLAAACPSCGAPGWGRIN
jgi:hypothetical protein